MGCGGSKAAASEDKTILYSSEPTHPKESSTAATPPAPTAPPPAAETKVEPTSKAESAPPKPEVSKPAEPATKVPRRGSITSKIVPRRFNADGSEVKREPPGPELLRDLLPEKMPVSAHIILGQWKCTEISKTYDAYLSDLGFPWIARKIAVPLAKSTITFYVKSFSEAEVRTFDRFLQHFDGNPLLGCKYKIGPKTMQEPLPGFFQPALLGPKIKEEIVRYFDGDTLVTKRDWSVLQNARSAFKPVPTEMRVSVLPGVAGQPDTLKEEVSWGDGKKYHRLFERVPFELWDCFQGSAPKRPEGKYYVWTAAGIKFAGKKQGMKADEIKNFPSMGIAPGAPYHMGHFSMIWNATGSDDPSKGYDWLRMCKEGYIEEVPPEKVAPAWPEETPAYEIAAKLVEDAVAYFESLGAKKNDEGKVPACQGYLRLIESDTLSEETFKALYFIDNAKFASVEKMASDGYLTLKASAAETTQTV